MKLLVTQSKTSTRIWNYYDGFIKPCYLASFTSHDLVQNNNQIYSFELPTELELLIIKHLLMIYLETRNFEQAFDLCTINKFICRMIYYQIYGVDKYIDLTTMIRRLARTFYLCESIYDEYLAIPNLSAVPKVAIVLTRIPSRQNRACIAPWDFDLNEMSLEEIDMENEIVDLHAFAGLTHGDTVWINGKEVNGIIEANVFEHPVISFILQDYTEALIPTENKFTANRSFWFFSRLLRWCFGKQTGVYYMAKEKEQHRNPFIHRSDTLVSL